MFRIEVAKKLRTFYIGVSYNDAWDYARTILTPDELEQTTITL